MINEEKQILLKDLCARLFYGVKIETKEGVQVFYIKWLAINMANIKNPYLPYLRPMSSMTNEEREEFLETCRYSRSELCYLWDLESYDWLNAHHFDYRGLVKKGLALPAPEGMYNF